MAAKMSLCTISYNYEHYAGIDVEKLSNIIYEYVKKEFADFNPQVSEPGSDMEMPDHVDMLLCKKDGSIFYESDILRRAVNIPHDCQMGGLVLEIFIQNCDGTRYKKRHAYPKPWCNHEANGKSDMRKLKIHKTISKRNLNNQEGKDSEGIYPKYKVNTYCPQAFTTTLEKERMMGQMGGAPQMPGMGAAVPQVQYYIGINGQQYGPCDWNKLQQLVQQGQFTQQSYVWKNGMAQWEFAGNVAELAPLFQGTAPQMPGMPPTMPGM